MEALIEKIRKNKPVVHCITNGVTMNDCANILLAVGASPIMAHHPAEVAEISAGAGALVCNFGATFDYETMHIAAAAALAAGKPIVVDPVGVAGSTYRREACLDFIEKCHPTCLRGNYAEILALMEGRKTGNGLDSHVTIPDEISEDADFVLQIKEFAKRKDMMIVASGKTDVITDGKEVQLVTSGDAIMRRVTGMGCMSSVVQGAFLAVEESVEGAAEACRFFGKVGELAAKKTSEMQGGTMTFRQLFIDEISKM